MAYSSNLSNDGSSAQTHIKDEPAVTSSEPLVSSIAYLSNPLPSASSKRNHGPDFVDDEIDRLVADEDAGGSKTLTLNSRSRSPSLPRVEHENEVTKKRKRNDIVDSIDHKLPEVSTKVTIAGGMFLIYKGVFESICHCWLRTASCPYKVVSGPTFLSKPLQNDDWKHWRTATNRNFCSRMTILDSKFQILRPQPLSQYEIKLASKALKLTAMAFASQWGIRGSAQQGRHSSFAMLMHRSLWNEARHALQLCAHLDSFRVILASLIFYHTAEPNDFEWFLEEDEDDMDMASPENELRDDHDTSEIQDVMITSGLSKVAFPFLQRSIKSLLSWKNRLGKSQLIDIEGNNVHLLKDHLGKTAFTEEIFQDFLLMIRLGIIYDSFSSCSSNIPHIITETEIRLENVEATSQGEIRQQLANQWNLAYLPPPVVPIMQDTDLEVLFEDRDVLERALSDSSTVSLSLWRRGGKLRTLLRQEAEPMSVENDINGILRIRTHWQNTYGRVIRYCIDNHSVLPFRFLIWYVPIGMSWSFLGLLIADCIEYFDSVSQTKTNELQRLLRKSKFLVYEMRKEAAFDITDIVKASLIEESVLDTDDEYHSFLLDYGALVTDPWSDLLNVNFYNTCNVLIGWITRLNGITDDIVKRWLKDNVKSDDLLQRVRYCITGLKQQSWKSTTSMSYFAKLRPKLVKIVALHADLQV